MGDKSRVFVRFRVANLTIYIWTFALWLGAGITGSAVSRGASMPSLWIVGGLALLAAIAERQSVPLTRNTEASVAFLPTAPLKTS